MLRNVALHGWSFWKRSTVPDTSPAHLKTSESDGSRSWSTYRTLSELPLTVFIRVSVHGEYDALILSGQPSEEEVQRVWLNLYSAFCELCGDGRVAALNKTVSQINALASRIARIKDLVERLRGFYSPVLVEILKTEGYRYQFDQANEAGYTADLDRVLSVLKRDEMKLDDLAVDAKKLTQGGAKTGESHYTETLMEISSVEGFRIRKEDISTEEYCMYLKRYREHIQHIKHQSAKKYVGFSK